MKKYKIRLKAITPVHIGMGEEYEPTNYVIDNGYLYEFDEVDFFSNLDDNMKKKFLKAVEKHSNDSLFEIHRLIKENKEVAKKVAFKKVQVSKALEAEYKNKLGKVVQVERKKDKVFKNFNIHKTLRFSKAPYQVYIPGSSLKGALLTAFGEYIYKKDKKLFNRMFKKCIPSQNGNIFKYVSVSDSKPLKTYSIIGYALNRERFDGDDQTGPNQQIEVIYSNDKQQSEFEFEITLKENACEKDYKVNINEIKKACNEHYIPIFEQMVDGYAYFRGKEVDDFTNEYFSNSFWEFAKRLKLKDNQFLLRVGKFSQARAVTIDGLRKIRVKESGGGPKRKPIRWQTLDQETTSWLFGLGQTNNNLLPFGWVICEITE